MTAAQQAQLNEAKTRVDGLERNGHNAGSIKFTLRQEGFAEAVIQQATEGRSMTNDQRMAAIMAHMAAIRETLPTPMQESAAATEDVLHDFKTELEGQV